MEQKSSHDIFPRNSIIFPPKKPRHRTLCYPEFLTSWMYMTLPSSRSFGLFLYYRHQTGGITYPQASSNLAMLGTPVSSWVKSKNCLLSSLLTFHLCYLFLFGFLHSTRAISPLSLVCILHNSLRFLIHCSL